MATGFRGGSAYIAFNGTALQSYYRSADGDEEIDLIEESAGSDAGKKYITGLTDGSKDLEIIMPSGTAGTAVYAAVAPGTEGTYEWGPEGTANGKARHYVNAILKSRGEPLKYNDLTTLSISLQFSGDVTNTTYS